MEKLHVIIAEHLIEVNSSSSNFINMFMENFHTITILQDARPEISIWIEEGYGVPFVNYNVTVTKELNKISFRRADYLIEVDTGYKNAKIFANNKLALKHALMNLYSSFIVDNHWGLLIHSSCVVENGGAHIFAGHSGAGKSTVARFSQPRMLLSDEASVIKITSDGTTAYQSPFRSELETVAKAACPLASIQILHQSLQVKRVKLRKSDALLFLIDKVFYWSKSAEETRTIMELLKLLVKTVPVYELYFQKNNKFWELIS